MIHMNKQETQVYARIFLFMFWISLFHSVNFFLSKCISTSYNCYHVKIWLDGLVALTKQSSFSYLIIVIWLCYIDIPGLISNFPMLKLKCLQEDILRCIDTYCYQFKPEERIYSQECYSFKLLSYKNCLLRL